MGYLIEVTLRDRAGFRMNVSAGFDFAGDSDREVRIPEMIGLYIFMKLDICLILWMALY